MAYSKQTWTDTESTFTSLSADRLNHIEDGIKTVDNTLNSLKVKYVTKTFSGGNLASGSQDSISGNVTVPSGYKAVAIVDVTSNHNLSLMYGRRSVSETGYVVVAYRNGATSTYDFDITVKVLCLPNSLF